MASVVIVAIGLGLFWGFIEKIRCFFKWKNSALTPVEWDDGPCACKSGTSARWNDLGPTPGTMCCRTKNWVNNWAKGWCVDMLEGDTCLFDDQCNSKYCKPGMTADSKCSPKDDVNMPSAWDKDHCKSGKSALWNDQGSQSEPRCCPTSNAVNNWGKGWCTELPLQSQCIFDDQCISKNCSPGLTAGSICELKKPANTVMGWMNGKECESGSSGHWNDRGAASETRCCPVNGTINNWGKGWCREIPIGGQCSFNDQCGSKTCRPELSADGICVNTDFNKACSEHNQCKSEWCHAGKCK